MARKILKRFPLNMTEHDRENIEVIKALNPLFVTDTAIIRIALEDKANSSGTPQEVNTIRKAYKKNMAKAREMAQ